MLLLGGDDDVDGDVDIDVEGAGDVAIDGDVDVDVADVADVGVSATCVGAVFVIVVVEIDSSKLIFIRRYAFLYLFCL